MKSTVRFSQEYFLKYSEKPVKLKPFSKSQETVAKLYLKKLQETLINFDAKIMIRGSTAFKISGKGDVEIGVYPNEADWDLVIGILKEKFGEPRNVEKNYARFNDKYEEVEVEVILLKGREAVTDIKLHDYLLTHTKLLKEYEEIKKKYAYSKREYNYQKNKFLRNVEKLIPEG